MDVIQHIGKRIHDLRKAKGINQEQFAEVLGYTRTSIVNIEKGRQAIPIDKLWIVCNILHCVPNDLFPDTRPIQYINEEVEVTIPAKTIKIKKLILSL